MSGEIEITRDFLMDAGGWKEMKTARGIHRKGIVSEAKYEDGMLSGVVRDGGKPKKVRVKINSRTDIENLCPCMRARREGIVCAHAVAVGLELIDPQGRVEEVGKETVAESKPAGPDVWPVVTEDERPDAVAVECHVLLPVNFEKSWERGQLMVGVELEGGGERRLLSAVGNAIPLFVGQRDAVVLAGLKALSPGQVPGVMTMGQEDFVGLLDALAGHPRLAFGKKAVAEVSFRPRRLAVEMKKGKVVAQWPAGATVLRGKAGVWVLEDGVFLPVAPGLPVVLRGVLESGWSFDAASGPAALAALGEWFEVPEDVAVGLPEVAVPGVVLRLAGSLNHLEAEFGFRYGGVERGGGDAAVVEVDGGGLLLTNPVAELAAEGQLQHLGFRGPDGKGKYVLKDKGGILRFHAFGMRRLDESWEVETDFRFEHAAKQVVAIEPEFEFRGSGEDWFEMGMGFRAGDGAVSGEEVRRILQSGVGHQQMKGGLLGVVDEEEHDDLLEILSDCDPEQSQAGVFRMDRKQVGYLREVVASGTVVVSGKVPWSGEKAEVLELGSLEEILRPYQREGLEWMVRLARLGMGGVLADDMGLGKTVQTLGMLRVLGGPALVVCPSSLVENWIAEAEKFVPDLKAVAIAGPKRAGVLAKNADADVFVTSYALLRQDLKVWKAREFKVVVLDEAQQIKNPTAQVSKAAFQLKAEHRFALTGTPLENSVRDLWSIMNFVSPGYLGGRKEFEERFAKPIENEDAAVQKRLALRLKPVLLRRMKQEVAKDLPEKIEQVVYCDLTKKQRAMYEALLTTSRESIEDAEGGRKRMMALTALLRLRQACCDLRLLDPEGIDAEDASVKLERIEQLVAEAVEGGHRVLVFSQFVQMLQVLVPMLGERGWNFCYLDGATKNRADVVRRFQEDEAVPVFLISLKAGGVGLNLTGADTVIHVDPWWNPAVEAQATDRAHRIGQERVVTSYKLIARDTVEEKILKLQERKRATLAATLEVGRGEGGVNLTAEEIFTLFK
ncbi:MAG: DEAD/DEAH box helicase [Akkermansiaceae bacterium]|nr:DEAD/DEAH box helicase [Akkermansiaceae bacterium]